MKAAIPSVNVTLLLTPSYAQGPHPPNPTPVLRKKGGGEIRD